MDRPHFDGFNLVARDVEATVSFYRRLGVDIPDDKIWRTDSGPHHTEGVVLGVETEIEIDSEALAAMYNSGFDDASRTVLNFRLGTREAVDALYDELLRAGTQSRQVPHDAFWGARYAIVSDPDGRDVGLMSPSSSQFRNQPPDL